MDDDGGHHENGRHKAEQYKASTAQGQWLIHHHQPSMKHIMAIIAERDAAIQERNLAVSEKKAALAERDIAFLQRDNAIQERNNVAMERDHALSSLQYRNELPYNNASTPLLLPVAIDAPPKPSRNSKRRPLALREKGCSRKDAEWKVRDLGLNQVAFDDSTMPCPGCSCTGVLRQCYKWGNGGWQSSCCTTAMSMHPLPAVPNKRHARVGGRKMSGSAFSKLLSRLAAQGQDLSVSVDLKEHWAKHGTNRYITIK